MARKRTRRRYSSGNFWESLVFKFGSKFLFGLLIVVIFLTLAQCTIKKPESPVWNTKLTIPAVNRTYGMAELIRKIDQEGIGIDSSGMVVYSITKDLDTVQLEQDLLTTSDLSYSASARVGTVLIGPPSVDPVTISIAAISGLANSLPGDSADVAPVSFDLYNNMPTISTFSSAEVANGSFDIVVDNNLGISLDTVIVQIYDVVNAAVVATDTFPQPISSGSTGTLPISLDSQSISNSFRIDEHCYTTGGLVDSVSTRYVTTDLVFTDSLEVLSAVAEIPALTRDFSEQIQLAETDRIDTAAFSSGNLNLSILNATNLSVDLTITIPDVVSPGGQPLTVDQPVSARQNTVVNVALSGYRLAPSDVTVPQEIEINVTAATPGTAPQQVQVNQSDSFFVNADLTSLTFAYVTGVFDSVTADFAGIEQEIDVPTGFDALELMTATMTLEIENSINLSGRLSLQLDGDNGKQLHFSGDIAAGAKDSTTWSSLSDSSVADFLSPIPSRITASGTAVLGDGISQGTVYHDDYLFGWVRIHAPLEVIVNESHIEVEIESESIDQDDIDLITEHVLEGRFIYNIINHLPLGARFNFFFSGDSLTLLPSLSIHAKVSLPSAVRR